MRAAVARPHQPVEPVSLGIRRHASVVRVGELPRNAAVWRRAGVVAGHSQYEAAVGAHGFPAGNCALRCGWVREAIGEWRCAVGVKRIWEGENREKDDGKVRIVKRMLGR